jgi:hypothetical protein
MRRALLLALGLMATQPSQAADTGATLRAFGLPGIWGENCRGGQETVLVRFSAASDGLFRVTWGGPDVVLSAATIVAAEQTSAAEIVLTLGEGFALPARRVILRRDGDGLLVWRSVLPPDGAAVIAEGRVVATGAPLPALHRCMSE